MGVIDSLSAGYRLTLRRLDLLVIPVLLDLLLWLAPRWSIAPVVANVAALYQAAADQAFAQAELSPQLADIAAGNSALLDGLGQSFNLLTGLVSGSLLHVPSLAIMASLPAPAAVWEIASAATALLLWLLLLLVGLFLGVVFLEQAARAVPLGAGGKPAGAAGFFQSAGRHWLRVLGFALLMLVLLGVVLLPASAVVGLMMLLAPPLGVLAWGVMMGLLLVAFVFLYFVTAAIVLDDLGVFAAIRTSAALVRSRLLGVLGFVVLVNVIGAGMAILLGGMAAWQPVGTVAAILINAFVGTGMAVGLLVFYRSALLRDAQAVAVESL